MTVPKWGSPGFSTLVWEEYNLDKRPLETFGVHLGKVKVPSPSSQPDTIHSYQTQDSEGPPAISSRPNFN